jgi:hypothetical protein
MVATNVDLIVGKTYDADRNEYHPQGMPLAAYLSIVSRAEPVSLGNYQMLSDSLKRDGRSDDANEVLFTGHVEQRRYQRKKLSWLNVGGWLSWLGSLILDWTVGYGLKVYRALLWAGVITIAGAVVFRTTPQARARMSYGLAFSFDTLLPVVKLRSSHEQIYDDIEGWQKYYFFFHKLAGYVLAFFVAAAISGLAH